MAVMGTRPEAIKVAPIVLELEKYASEIETCLVLTAQHREMLDQVVSLFDLRFQHDLGVMRPGQTLAELTSRLVAALDLIMGQEKPQLVLVQGDTTSTFVGALVAFYHRIPVGHIEAGLRSFDKDHPFPEEVNRTLTTSLSELHFAPTQRSAANLKAEGIDPSKIFITGNPVIDALLKIRNKKLPFRNEQLQKIDFKRYRTVLLTAHRRENFGAPLEDICQAVLRLVERFDDLLVVCPVHLNPRAGDPVRKYLGNTERIWLVPPLSYEDLVAVMERSYLILTDSGGIQEEAPALGKPVLVLREVTERPEGIAAGTVQVVGTDTENIVKAASTLLEDSQVYATMANAVNPYGDGLAAQRIVDLIRQYFNRTLA